MGGRGEGEAGYELLATIQICLDCLPCSKAGSASVTHTL